MVSLLYRHFNVVRSRACQVPFFLRVAHALRLKSPLWHDYPLYIEPEDFRRVVLSLLDDLANNGLTPGYFVFTLKSDGQPEYQRFRNLDDYEVRRMETFDRLAKVPGAFAQQSVAYAVLAHFSIWNSSPVGLESHLDYRALHEWMKDDPRTRVSLSDLVGCLAIRPLEGVTRLDSGGVYYFVKEFANWRKRSGA